MNNYFHDQNYYAKLYPRNRDDRKYTQSNRRSLKKTPHMRWVVQFLAPGYITTNHPLQPPIV